MKDILSQKGLPCNVDCERFTLGSILLDEAQFAKVGRQLKVEDFTLDQNRKVFKCMRELDAAGTHIDRVTVASELDRIGELKATGGLSYLISLDEGLPALPNIESYAQILREKSALRRIIYLSEKAKNIAVLQEHPPLKIIRDLRIAAGAMESALDPERQSWTNADILEESGGIQGFMTEAITPGVSTGFPQIDEAMLGLQKGAHYVFAGRTGSGKSAIAQNIAVHVAKAGHPVEFYSLEMPRKVLLARAMCAEAGLSFRDFVQGKFDHDEREMAKHALAELADLPMYIDDTPGLTINSFAARVDKAVLQHGTRLVILDYLQIIHGDPEMKLITGYQRVTYASQTCRMVARKHGISSIGLSQLSRPADKRKPGGRPTLSDLRESGAIEQDADAVAFVHRPEMFDRNNHALKGKAEFIFEKARSGNCPTLNLRFHGPSYKFSAWEGDPPHAYADHHTEKDEADSDDD